MFGVKHIFLWSLVAASGALPQNSPAASASSAGTSLQAGNCTAPSILDYVVTLRPGLSEGEATAHLKWLRSLPPSRRRPQGPQGIYHYGENRGYSGNFDDEAVKKIESRKEVKSISRNQLFHINSTPQWNIQKQASWSLGDITPGPEDTKDQYTYDARAGNGTFVYVFDTGINSLHEEFETRVIERICLADECEWPKPLTGRSGADINGHGTHVAGIIAGAKFGVAKQAQIIDVRICKTKTCPGLTYVTSDVAAILQALAWTKADVRAKGRQGRAVINFSIGCKNFGINRDVQLLFSDVFEAGILPVVCAGNEGLPAKWSSPRGQPEVLTVGAHDKNHKETGFSNYGPAVDILAPGVDIKSANWKDPLGAAFMDGTSMATAYASGMALYLLSVSNNITSPKDLKQTIIDMASDNVTVLEMGTTGRGKGKIRKAGSRSPRRRLFNKAAARGKLFQDG
ncbi:putative subtilisin-like protease [Ophiocordyceps camponoti-leonardi (nom. inval.)]|nr:putative subtilisin-like protease [Ophiocordyceps camponoti-leonardi (nom. inval.)]